QTDVPVVGDSIPQGRHDDMGIEIDLGANARKGEGEDVKPWQRSVSKQFKEERGALGSVQVCAVEVATIDERVPHTKIELPFAQRQSPHAEEGARHTGRAFENTECRIIAIGEGWGN